MELSTIIAELKSEREKIGRAIAALIGSAEVSGKVATRKAAGKKTRWHYPGRATPIVAGDEETLGAAAGKNFIP